MKAFTGYEAKKQVAREPLPAGGYVVKILDAAEVSYDWGSVLELSFDVLEGEKKDFFRNDYKANTNEDRKWKGKYRLNIPKDDGSERDGWTKNSFNGAMFAFEDSNKGYRWDWNEKGLKGLTVGALFRNREWEWNDKTGWTTECCALIPAEDVRKGDFRMPKDRPLPAKAAAAPAFSAASIAFEEISADDDDIPFRI